MYANFLSSISSNGWLAAMDESGNLNDLTNNHIRVYTIECEDFNRDPARYMVDV